MNTEPHEEIPRSKDFTKKRTQVWFELDGDKFICMRKFPMATMRKVVAMKSIKDDENADRIAVLVDIITSVMKPESAELFRTRVNATNTEDENGNSIIPIDMAEINEIVPWLLEVYGMRPTQVSKQSSDGSSTHPEIQVDGTSSMDGVQAGTLTQLT